ncbi:MULTISPECIES: alpha/beta fold hydrolase [Streptococcus]|uniref:Alpha/beta fold hydrolase n=1 Tax=Streptococcus mitis TaxID=28037 RepID=A0A3R9J4G1_STRMT|nr:MULTISPECIES: alpha/beta hydrolase [Streptococcus]MBZ2105610.1 alpha/beta hydrolase [Streptococcus mitis]MBZ2109138.1 alpha/beta hydrolase [Streptococcus mitis]RRD34402.1 alpha/beta hydrolase [Streptococcus sp. OH4692_COT-348]RSI99006.1 haloalkane dehalogenase [Streptococcus mitis]TKD49469.1 alpha/beta fold hydrolase [Streptococcus mitis]
MKQNDIAEAIAFYNRKPETLVRHVIPVVDCDLVVYHRHGNTNKGHIIFYHGACGRSQMWAHQYDAFEGFDLYFVNVRGQGESPMKVGLPDLEGAVQDVDAILSYFQLDKVVLVGHSWGGNPLQEYTYRHPERVLALVMVDSWGQHRYLSDKERNRIKYSSLMYKTIPWKMIADKNSKMCSDNPITRELVKTAIKETGRDVFLNLGITGFLAVHEIEGYHGNPPMLLVRGENDFPKHLKMIYDGIIALNPNARQVTISDSKHQPMNDHPEEFNQIIGEFFEEVVAL